MSDVNTGVLHASQALYGQNIIASYMLHSRIYFETNFWL